MPDAGTVREPTLEEMSARRAEWSALCERSTCTPFQRPEWLLPWCRWLAPGPPWLVTVTAGERLAAFAPLVMQSSDGRRVVGLLGAGVSDHLDALVERGREQDSGACILQHLAKRRDQWDVCELDDLASTAALAVAPAPAGWGDAREPAEPSPRITWDGGGGGRWESAVPHHQLARLRKYRRRLERDSGAELACTRDGGWSGPLEDLFRLHDERWRSRGGAGVLADPRVRAFHRDVAEGFAARGALRLYRLVARGASLAAIYGFVEKDTLFCYLQGIDPAAAHLSPGTVLLGMVLEDAAREGLAAVDFLRGREAYKYAWGATDVPALTRRLEHE
jgi:CelD/BcsL family acetyltransferase involved in cellulose biosynthesis